MATAAANYGLSLVGAAVAPYLSREKIDSMAGERLLDLKQSLEGQWKTELMQQLPSFTMAQTADYGSYKTFSSGKFAGQSWMQASHDIQFDGWLQGCLRAA